MADGMVVSSKSTVAHGEYTADGAKSRNFKLLAQGANLEHLSASARMVFKQLQHVKPVAQEAAYTPLKDRVEELVREKVDGWVDDAAQGKRTAFTVKTPAYVPASKEVLKRPPSLPSLTDSSLQSTLPGFPASQGPMTTGLGINEDGIARNQPADSVPSLMP